MKMLKSYIRLRKLQEWYITYERYLIPGALIFGFITDILTFHLIDFNIALLLLLGHVALSGASIAFIDLYESGRLRTRFFSYVRVFAPLTMQYSFGALLSASVIFYSYSGSLSASWPFMIVLVFLMIANEVLRKYYVQPITQMTVYFFAVFSFAILAVPYVARSIGSEMFLVSGGVSVAFIGLFLYTLYPVVPKIQEQLRWVAFGVASVLLLMNVFYFTNLIPPFPLALADAGVHYSITRTPDGNYQLLSEEREWYRTFLPDQPYHVTAGTGSAYVFTAIFAPTRLRVDVVHEWQYRDPAIGSWRTVSQVPFTVSGGRDGGYRGYSRSSQIVPGRWRVNVKTTTGQTIGRVSFRVFRVNELPELHVEIK